VSTHKRVHHTRGCVFNLTTRPIGKSCRKGPGVTWKIFRMCQLSVLCKQLHSIPDAFKWKVLAKQWPDASLRS